MIVNVNVFEVSFLDGQHDDIDCCVVAASVLVEPADVWFGLVRRARLG
jgi:hypothetical protein